MNVVHHEQLGPLVCIYGGFDFSICASKMKEKEFPNFFLRNSGFVFERPSNSFCSYHGLLLDSVYTCGGEGTLPSCQLMCITVMSLFRTASSCDSLYIT